jgi:hypothetical protein
MKPPLSLLAFLLLAGPLYAACPLVTDTSDVVALGRSELDLGYGATNTQTVLSQTAGLVFRHGFLPQFDFAVAVPYTLSSPAGLNDIYLHAKYRLWQSYGVDGLACRLDYKANNGNVYQGLGSGDNDARFLLIYSRVFGWGLAHFNFGYINTGVNAGRVEDDYFLFSSAFEQPAFDNKGMIFEELVVNNALSPSPAFFLLGVRYPFVNRAKIDMGYAFGFNNNSIKSSLTVELHYEI